MTERKPDALNDDDVMWFGKWSGTPLGDVPDYYWVWFLKQPWSNRYPALVDYAKCVEDDDE